MHRYLISGLVLIASLAAFVTATPRSSAAPMGAEQDNEPIVHRGALACGVERWAVKTGIDRDAHLVNTAQIVPTNILHLRSLAPPPDLQTYARSRIKPIETTVFQVSAILLRYKTEADSDYHLVIADAGGRTMIAEIPSPSCVGSSSVFLHQLRSVRTTFTSRFHPSATWVRGKWPAVVTGVAFFDFKHGQSGVAPNAIELHPVLAITSGTSTVRPTSPAPRPPASNKPVSGFFVTASVSPRSMPYGAHPTLYGKTLSGASCTASVTYTTGRHPVSFDGSAHIAGSSGIVSWSWHEETKGSGGTGTVVCTYRGQTKSGSASFTVTG